MLVTLAFFIPLIGGFVLGAVVFGAHGIWAGIGGAMLGGAAGLFGGMAGAQIMETVLWPIIRRFCERGKSGKNK